MAPRRKNCVSDFVRRTYPDLMENNFDQYHNIVSKLRSRAKARGLKEENNFLLQASHLNPIQIDLVRDRLQTCLANFIIKNVEETFVNEI